MLAYVSVIIFLPQTYYLMTECVKFIINELRVLHSAMFVIVDVTFYTCCENGINHHRLRLTRLQQNIC